MVHNVKASKDFLKSIVTASRPKRKSMISKATPEQLKALQEITLNVASNTIPLTPCQRKKLVRGGYRKTIISVASKRGTLNSKRKTLVQKGGYLPVVIPLALSFLKKYL